MKTNNACILLIICYITTLSGCFRGVNRASITQDELVRRTQELVDAVGEGDRRPWKKYFADDCLFFDEKGNNMNKETLVADISPLPSGYSGSIKVQNAKSYIEGDVAILSYDLNETEIAYGQEMKARYHETDTWMRRGGDWQIVAGQVLRYYEDPAAGVSDAKKYPDYVGTYEAAPGKTMTVSLKDGHLYRQRGGGPRQELIPEAEGIFFRKGAEGRTLFRRAADGKVEALIDRRNNEDIVWRRAGGG